MSKSTTIPPDLNLMPVMVIRNIRAVAALVTYDLLTKQGSTKSRPLNIEISKEDSTSTLASPCTLPRTRSSLVNDENDTDNVNDGDTYDLGWIH